ncbi:MAG: AAA family ATPase [Deltaproteobacteria bacterium]|nr:AAA family ATPase [Deltaproteobacteria bacterium]
MIAITVFPRSKSEPSSFEGIGLQRDGWNDFSFMTLYHLYVSMPEFSGRIGQVKILRRGQTKADGLLLPVGTLAPLGPDFVSLGQDLDYYERLATLPEDLRKEVLEALRDALAYPDHAAAFLDEPGWSTSVVRDIEWETFRRDAAVLLARDYTRVARLGLDLSFQVRGWADPLRLSFEAPGDRFWRNTSAALPDRVAILIGRNGAGKSTLISRLARILHASQRDRASEALQSLGEIEPAGIGFTRVVNLAYSAFDAFQLPGVGYPEQKQIVDDMARGSGRYHYCGLRSMRRELMQAEGIGDVDGNPIQPLDLDRQERIILKSSQELSDEFGTTIGQIQEAGRQELFGQVCRILATDASFTDLGTDPATAVIQAPIARFDSWSTGHKIVMHAAASLVAFTEPKSIVLFDEPESHLHPPLLAALMHAMRLILRQNDAFAVIATHSPVVVQETLARHIAVVRRSAETRIRPPTIETYGESIGEITNEVFGLATEATDFHKTLAALVDAGMTLEGIEKLFDKGMSLQARAFVMTLLASR